MSRERQPWELAYGKKAKLMDMAEDMIDAEHPWDEETPVHYTDEELIIMIWMLWEDDGLYPYYTSTLMRILEERGIRFYSYVTGYSDNFKKEGMLSHVWHEVYKDIYSGWHIGWYNPNVIYPLTDYTDVRQMEGKDAVVHTLEQAKEDTTEKVWEEVGGAYAVREALKAAGFYVGIQ